MSGPQSIRPPVTLRVVPDASEPGDGHRDPVVVHVLTGRADAVRLAPVVAALASDGAFRQVVVHAGAPQDLALVASVEDDLDLPAAGHVVRAASTSAAELTATTLTGFDGVLRKARPDLVVLSGDTSPTLACALATAKRGVAVAHLESGLRSLDWTTPEEVNRVVIDRLADTLLAHGRDAAANLVAEGVPEGRVHAVGSTAIDALRTVEARARARATWATLGLAPRSYVLVTLHRPGTVGEPRRLAAAATALARLQAHHPVVFPLHPRTRDLLARSGGAPRPRPPAAPALARLQAPPPVVFPLPPRTRALLARSGGLDQLRAAGVRCTPPLGHVEFLSLQVGAGAIVTDSGAVQEESSALGVPCHTLRALTERPATLLHGSNVLLGDDPAAIEGVRLTRAARVPCAVPLWDGHAARRVADVLVAHYALRAPWTVSG